MNDLIDRQAAIDAICSACNITSDYTKCTGYPESSRWCEEITALRNVPSVSGCEQCQHNGGEAPIADGRYWCTRHESFMYYCSDEERKD